MWALVSGDKGFAFPLPQFPSRKGRQSKPCAELACLLLVESPWKLSESPLFPQGGDQGLGRISPWASTPTLCNLSWRKRQAEAFWGLPAHGPAPRVRSDTNYSSTSEKKPSALRLWGSLESCPRVHRLYGSKADKKRPKRKPEAQGGWGASLSVECGSGALIGPQDSHLLAQ